jgi:phage gp46-like protein
MNGLQEFEGDAMLYETLDGGDLMVDNGLFISENRFSTAVYLSLFGGNKTDPGKVKNNGEWWGNKLNGITESEKLRSRFQYIINGLPMSVKNIKEAETAAEMDLKWFIDEKIADQISVYGQAVGKNRFKLKVEILKDALTLFENAYSLLWGAGYGDSV